MHTYIHTYVHTYVHAHTHTHEDFCECCALQFIAPSKVYLVS